MDYEKAYKEALALAKSYYSKGTNEFLDTIFPELAESEDERIRKAIYDFISKHFKWDDEKALQTRREMLAYLEKQKEQKPAEWSEEDEDMLNSCISSIEEAKENRYAYKETDGDTSYDYEIDWLKSLRPQHRRKPSGGQPGVDLEKEIDDYIGTHFSEAHDGVLLSDASRMELAITDIAPMARHFYELGLNAKKEE